MALWRASELAERPRRPSQCLSLEPLKRGETVFLQCFLLYKSSSRQRRHVTSSVARARLFHNHSLMISRYFARACTHTHTYTHTHAHTTYTYIHAQTSPYTRMSNTCLSTFTNPRVVWLCPWRSAASCLVAAFLPNGTSVSVRTGDYCPRASVPGFPRPGARLPPPLHPQP